MTDPSTEGEPLPTLSQSVVMTPSSSMTVLDATSILHLFEQMLLAMETRLNGRIEDAVVSGTKRSIERFERIESAHAETRQLLDGHLQLARDKRLADQARIAPIRTSAEWLLDHWRDFAIVFLGLAVAAQFIIDRVSGIVR